VGERAKSGIYSITNCCWIAVAHAFDIPTALRRVHRGSLVPLSWGLWVTGIAACGSSANQMGTLVVHDHVDDSRLTSTTAAIRSRFYRAWAAEFNSPPEPSELSEKSTGLRHHRVSPTTVEMSYLGVVRSLEGLLAEYPLARGVRFDTPLPADALTRLREPHDAGNPLRIASTIGFITNMVRPDAHFGYCVIARYLSEEKLTQRAFTYLLRVGHYLVSTKTMCLTLTAPANTPTGLDLFSIHADSSYCGGRPQLWWVCPPQQRPRARWRRCVCVEVRSTTGGRRQLGCCRAAHGHTFHHVCSGDPHHSARPWRGHRPGGPLTRVSTDAAAVWGGTHGKVIAMARHAVRHDSLDRALQRGAPRPHPFA
jgi:hypothetical protein